MSEEERVELDWFSFHIIHAFQEFICLIAGISLYSTTFVFIPRSQILSAPV